MLIKIFMPGVKVVSMLHEPLKRLKFTGRLRLAINLAFSDAAVFVEEENMKTTGMLIAAALGNRAKKVIEIGSKIPKAVLKGSEKKKIQKQAGLRKGRKLMVTFGFITGAKGFDEIVKAFDFLKFKWVHLGRVNESEAFQAEWKQKAIEAGVFGQIKFIPGLGPQKIAQWLASADLCVFPFKGGLSPRNGSFLAAAQQDTYIVTASRDKHGFYPGENIYYVKPGSPEELKTAMDFTGRRKRTKKMVPEWNDIAMKHLKMYGEMMGRED